MMKGARNFAQGILVGGFVALSVAASAADEMQLEPCVNGDVSASGRYPSQAAENAAMVAERKTKTDDIGSGNDAFISAVGGDREDLVR
ncbi:MAG: hypothetical protein QNK18_15700 [Gammaproteobacteria bacterium]|nr:hypothetical protein [Gammaproteobacteria bacterium]MDJ0892622.1 hypothetical protein [Gammaproteobacteria bacterium]